MVRHKWSRINVLGIFILLILICWTSSKATTKKKELKIRNKREGAWTQWSSYSPCSRTCGGGIRTQTRQCQIRLDKSKSKDSSDDPRYYRNVSSRHCEGHASRHHMCNTEECSTGVPDIREFQCKAFDNRAYMGKVYNWEPIVDERSPCALTCRAKGFRFFATLNKSVIDGTPCSSNPFDSRRCIGGVCMAIGCDGVAGSHRRFDRCGVCGGDNSTCRVVSGIFTQPQLTVGYNVVAHIPRGACNLNITQLRKSANRLALRKVDGTFILNGEWRVAWPGVYDGAGTKFYYSRQDPKLLESIVSAGPLQEPIDLMVVYQQPNPGIKYEYMLPLGDSPIPPVPILDPLATLGARQQSAATYRPTSYINNGPPRNGHNFNSISSFPKLQPSAGSTAVGLYPGDSAIAYKPENSHLHGHHHGRRRGHGHGHGSKSNTLPTTSDKKFHWKMVGYTNCSEPCGGGTQRSVIKCVKTHGSNPVADRRCAGEEKPVAHTVRCNLKPCPAEWGVGTWSSCSETCGEGVKTRPAFCQQKVSPTLTMRVAEGACLKAKPESQTKCFIRPCHRWEASEWSQCSAHCGNGIRRRTVICVDSRGKKINPQDCDDSDRPTEIFACNMGPCEGTEWFMSDWSPECSQKCGGGIHTRHVVCSGNHRNFTGRRRPSSSEAETNSIEDEDEFEDEDAPPPVFHCDESKKPLDERECFSEKSCEHPAWFTGEWSECTAICGNGVKSRLVLCVLFSRGKFKVVEDNLCSRSKRPEDKAVCESNQFCTPRWFTGEWSECSVPCGGGTQKRNVSCRAGNWTKASSFCADTDRPLDKRSCNEHKCSKNTDSSGMVKDTSPVPEHEMEVNRNGSISKPGATFEIQNQTSTIKPPSSSTFTTNSPRRDHGVVEDPEDSECTDQYRNCPLVVQARLCRYKYYRSVCCNACSEAPHHDSKL